MISTQLLLFGTFSSNRTDRHRRYHERTARLWNAQAGSSDLRVCGKLHIFRRLLPSSEGMCAEVPAQGR
jgi:hypothetical protein